MEVYPNICRLPDLVRAVGEGFDEKTREAAPETKLGPVTVSFAPSEDGMPVRVASERPLSFVILRWYCAQPNDVRILGNWWSGAHSMEWRGIVPERSMPWYFFVSNEDDGTAGYGVQTRPHAAAVWYCDGAGVTLELDLRSGSRPVRLGGRTLDACTVLCEEYGDGVDCMAACRLFCGKMCPDPIFPRTPVYGGNNWYYAYGKSSRAEILEDAAYMSSLAEGLKARPFMVIDDGWQKNVCAGPWTDGGKDYGDMKSLADGMRKAGTRPGLWTRLLYDLSDDLPAEWQIKGVPHTLDPSVPAVLDHVRADVTRFTKEWGYELVKHDYSTYDLFGTYYFGNERHICPGERVFADDTRTSAEIIIDFYTAVREAAGDALVIGCNTVSHLCAGLVELQRTGNDTSGKVWDKTRSCGVNALAFHLPEDGTFYTADPDCIGITEMIPWKQNREWLRALVLTGSPLFVSSKKGVASPEIVQQLKDAFQVASQREFRQGAPLLIEPIDWKENVCPALWVQSADIGTTTWNCIGFEWYDEDGVKIL